MKKIEEPGSRYWQGDILNDLSFIKKKKRYPLGKKTFTPVTLIIILLAAIARIAWPIFIGATMNNTWVLWIVSILIILMIMAVGRQYYSVLKFDTIHTPFNTGDNIELLQKFFKTNNLAYSRHPEAPEVLMIISKNLNITGRKEYREVMVFIADDKQILVNSHFTGNKFSVTPPSGNYRKMARTFTEWLSRQPNQSSSSTAVKRR